MTDAPWTAFVARRWFAAKRETGGSAASALAAAGIAVGVAALIVVLGVMNGFQLGFIDSILEVSSYHVRIDDARVGGPDDGLLARLAADSSVESVLPFVDTRALASSGQGRSAPLLLRSVPPDAAARDPRLAAALGLAAPLFPAGGGLVVGAELARSLNVEVGDEVSVLVVSANPAEGVRARTIPLRVARTFRSGYYDFDAGMAFLSFAEPGAAGGAADPSQYTYGVKLKDRYADAAFVRRLASEYGLPASRIEGWRDYNRAFFGALRTEKTVMMLLIGLIFLVVGVNIHHAMRRSVAERTEDIAVLRALGAEPESVRRAFILDGLAVGAGGAAAGLLLGLLVAVNVNEVFAAVEALVNGAAALAARLAGSASGDGFRVFSPQYFYLMEVPVRILFPETLFIVAAAVASSAAAAASATARVSGLAPAEALRYE